MKTERLEQWIHGLVDGWIGDADRQELVRVLRASREARVLYWQVVGLHHEMIELAERDDAARLQGDGAWQDALDALVDQESHAEIQLVDLTDRLNAPDVSTVPSPARHSFEPQASRPDGEVFSIGGITVHRNPAGGGLRLKPLLAAAALVLLGVFVWSIFAPASPPSSPIADNGSPPVQTPLETPAPPQAPTFAELSTTTDARWIVSDAAPWPGQRLGGGVYELSSGFAELTLDDGAVVLLEGPCRFELTSANAVRLDRGRLGGEVRGPVKGLMIQTPGSVITDLGTVFYVDVDTDRQTLACTVEGLITVQPRGAQGPQGRPVSLAAGQAVTVSGDARLVSLLDASAPAVSTLSPFDRQRRQRLGIDTLSDTVDLRDDLPLIRVLNDDPSLGRITLIREATGLVAGQPILLDSASPLADANIRQALLLPPGTRFDTYLLIFKTAGFPSSEALEFAAGQVRFLDAPFGVQHTKQSMELFPDQIGGDWSTRLPQKLGTYHAELTDPNQSTASGGDRLTYGADGRTLDFVFSARSADIVRVFVPSRSTPGPERPH